MPITQTLIRNTTAPSRKGLSGRTGLALSERTSPARCLGLGSGRSTANSWPPRMTRAGMVAAAAAAGAAEGAALVLHWQLAASQLEASHCAGQQGTASRMSSQRWVSLPAMATMRSPCWRPLFSSAQPTSLVGGARTKSIRIVQTARKA